MRQFGLRIIWVVAIACGGGGGDDADRAVVDAPAGTGDAPATPTDGGTDAGLDAMAPPALPDVNGCTYATAQDFTTAALTVTFPGLSYTPKCARIRAGQTVRFQGSFAGHPLRAGKVTNGTATPAQSSPIASTSSGTTATFAFPAAGAFPYYCDFHYGAGMFGAIYVEP